MRFREDSAARRALAATPELRRGLLAAVLAATALSIGCGSAFFRPYEYEEEVYLSLDGTATVYLNGSVAALGALRGAPFDPSPAAGVDREKVAQYFSSPATHVTALNKSRRQNRWFVHVRLDVDDIRRLATAAPFAWSSYKFQCDGDACVYQQTVGAPAAMPIRDVGWTGRELVAFRLHLPSKIDDSYNGLADHLKRGNILVWEQPLRDRLLGKPVVMDVRMGTQSILNRTLWLFGATFVAVAITFGLVIWWIVDRGARVPEVTSHADSH